MIFWDITKTVKAKAYSGLTRVSRRLLEALNAEGVQVQSCRWSAKRGQPMAVDGSVPGKGDCWITPELFSEEENPGLERWLGETAATTVALYHDAIPLRHPEFTWPKSVARHPFYMKLLACCDGVLANSEASRSELLAYWEWAGIGRMPPVEAIPLGADFLGDSRVVAASPEVCRPVRLLMTGILEPRKNHALVLDACALLSKWNVPWELDLVGRVNPHFGKPILQRIKAWVREGALLRYHGQVSDLALRALYRETHLTLFPSLAEGNGLPVIESMWQGKPCLCSPLPCHREHADMGGMRLIEPMHAMRLAEEIRRYQEDGAFRAALASELLSRSLPTWKESALELVLKLQGFSRATKNRSSNP